MCCSCILRIPCVKFPFPCRLATDMLWSTSTIWNSKCIKPQNIRVKHAFYTVMRCLVTCYITGEKQFSMTAVKSPMTHWQHFMDVWSCIKYDGRVGWMNGVIGVYMISCIFQITSISLFSPWLVILKINSHWRHKHPLLPLRTQQNTISQTYFTTHKTIQQTSDS